MTKMYRISISAGFASGFALKLRNASAGVRSALLGQNSPFVVGAQHKEACKQRCIMGVRTSSKMTSS